MIYRLFDSGSRFIGTLATEHTDIESAIPALMSTGPWVTVDTVPGTQRKVNLNHITYIDAMLESLADDHPTTPNNPIPETETDEHRTEAT
jgi:hypothetical protein